MPNAVNKIHPLGIVFRDDGPVELTNTGNFNDTELIEIRKAIMREVNLRRHDRRTKKH